MANTIVLSGKGHYIEGTADEGIYPGMPVQLMSTGNYRMWDGTANECDLDILAIEDALQGRNHTTTYATGERLLMYIPLSGDVCQVRLKTSENVAIGDRLVREDNTGLWIKSTGAAADTWNSWICLEASNVAAVVYLKARKV